jgi:hypothetical protein
MNVMDDARVKQLVETIQKLEALRLEAKQVASDYRERITTIETEVSVIAENIRTGQKTLFTPTAEMLEAAAKIAPKRGSEVESVTITHRENGKQVGDPVTLTVKDGERLRKTAGVVRRKQRARA